MMPPLDSGTGYALKASPSYRMIEYPKLVFETIAVEPH
jgi:hypothetical protein